MDACFYRQTEVYIRGKVDLFVVLHLHLESFRNTKNVLKKNRTIKSQRVKTELEQEGSAGGVASKTRVEKSFRFRFMFKE